MQEKNKTKIKVAIVGCGNCAKSIVSGAQYYHENPDDTVGLIYPDFGGYNIKDIQFVIGFDVDKRKVSRSLRDALYAAPNCSMDHVDSITNNEVCPEEAMVYSGPVLDGVADHMLDYPEEVSFRIGAEPANSMDRVIELLQYHEVDIVLNYLPVGSQQASEFYIDAALEAGCNVVNCIPTFIATDTAIALEQKFIDKGLTIIMSDMRSQFGASRLSEVLQGSMLDAGLLVTQHIQENKAAGSTQGQENIRCGRTANTDFLNMAKQNRLHDKHVSKENVLKGQNVIRDLNIAGHTLYAGPSLTVLQKPGGHYVGSDNKIANIDIIAYGWAGARYEMTARLNVQDSANSSGIVIPAIMACRVANEMGIVGCLRGPSAYTQKSPPVQLSSADAKFECDALSRRELTNMTRPQLKDNLPVAKDLPYTLQKSKNDYV